MQAMEKGLMAHRDKRSRVSGSQDSKSIDATSATIARADLPSVADTELVSLTTSKNANGMPVQIDGEPVRTPDKSAWKGWAEIENDPVWQTVFEYIHIGCHISGADLLYSSFST
jgi:hypothetical protein